VFGKKYNNNAAFYMYICTRRYTGNRSTPISIIFSKCPPQISHTESQ